MPDVVWNSYGAEKVIRDYDKVAAAQERHRAALVGTERQAREMERIGQAIAKQNETAWEKFTRQIQNAKRAFDAGTISTQTLRQETTRLTLEFNRANDSIDAATAAIRRQKVEIGNYAVNLNGVIQSSQQAFGPGAVSMLQRYGAVAAKIFGPLSVVGEMDRDVGARFSQAGGRAIEAARAGGGLAMLARGDPGRLSAMMAQADVTFREGAFESRSEARRLQYELEKQKLGGDRAFFSRLQELTDAAQLARAVGGVRSAFGVGRAGTAAQIVSKAIPAAAAGEVDREELLRGVARAARAGRPFGGDDAEIYAMVARVASTGVGGESAGREVSNLLNALRKRGFADRGSATAAIAAIAGRGLSKTRLSKLLGARQALTFTTLADTGATAGLTAEIQAAETGLLAEREVATFMARPDVATGRIGRGRQAAAELAQEEKGLRRRRIEDRNEQMRGEMYSELPAPMAWAADKLYSGGSILGIPLPGASSFIPDVLEDPGIAQATPANTMDELARQLDANTKATRENTRASQGRTGPPEPRGRRER